MNKREGSDPRLDFQLQWRDFENPSQGLSWQTKLHEVLRACLAAAIFGLILGIAAFLATLPLYVQEQNRLTHPRSHTIELPIAKSQ